MFTNLIRIDPDATETLQKQIRRQIAQAIVNHRVGASQKLPSIRTLARTLGVSTTTVVQAYELLRVDGFIKSRNKSGFFVDPEAVSPKLQTTDDLNDQDIERIDFARIFGGRWSNVSLTIRQSDSLSRYEYPFLWGLIDPTLFPVAQWRECALDATSTLELRNWAGDFSQYDDPLLVEQLLQMVLPARGIFARPEQILITSGSQNAAFLAIKLLLQSGEVLGIENPGYSDVMNMARIEGVYLQPLRHGADGIDYDQPTASCKCLYVTPSHQVPTNSTMSLEARKALLQATAANNQVIIEDDYGCDVDFMRELPPSICGLGKAGNVVYISSPSDSFVAGLRVGYMVADHEVIRRARVLRKYVLRHPPVNNQRSLAIFIQRGYLGRLHKTLNKAFRQRSQIAFDAIAEFFPPLPELVVEGSTSLWLRLPEGISAVSFREALLAQGIYVESGADSFLEPETGRPYILIGLTAIDEAKIRPGLKKIGKTLRAMI